MGALEHVPELHDSPLQHVFVAEQVWPVERHTGAVPQNPELHESPLQHALPAEQVCPEPRQVGGLWQRPVAELQVRPEQHEPPKALAQSSPLFEQLPPPVPPMHWPPPQVLPPQQSPVELQVCPGSWQNCKSAQQLPLAQE